MQKQIFANVCLRFATKNKKSHILHKGKCRDDKYIVIPLCFTLTSRQRASSGANTPIAHNGRQSGKAYAEKSKTLIRSANLQSTNQ